MKKHPEKEVPSWATSMVSNYRSTCNLPPEITDGMIFYRIEELRGADNDVIEQYVAELLEE